MFQKAFSSLVVALVLGCPLICGGAALLHHDEDSTPASEGPHSPHDSCTFDPCFCNGPSVLTPGPAYDFSASTAAVWMWPCDAMQDFAPSTGFLAASERPPRSVEFARSIPLLI